MVVTDGGNNSSELSGFSFVTLADTVPPPNVTGFQITTTSNSVILNWVNPATNDFVGVKILRGINSQISGPNDLAASLSHTTGGQTFVDTAVLPNIDYYYSIFSFDTSNNFSSGVYRVGRIVQVTQEVCGNGVDDDNNGKADCADDVCKNLPSCVVPIEICNNGIDDDSDGLIDCADTSCASSCVVPSEICNNNIDDDTDGLVDCADTDCAGSCAVGVSAEICGNGIDDDDDRLIDCADVDCGAFAGCQQAAGVAACSNGVDDDNDGLIDFPNDPGCSDVNDNNEYDVPPTTVPEFARLDFNKILFFAGNRQIILAPQERTVVGLAGAGLSVGLPLSAMNSAPENIQLNVEGQNHQASFVSSSQMYFVDLVFPVVGKHEIYLEINYGTDQLETVAFNLLSLPKGQVTEGGDPVSGASVALKQKGNVEPYLGVYGELNPTVTDVNGLFGWIVPNGEYYLEIKKEGFYERITPVFVVGNNVVNSNIKLIKKAETILESVSVVTQLSVQKIEDVANNPVVERTATEIVTPAVVGVTAVSTVAAVSWFNLVSLLRFVFLQPLMLLGRRKREKWGMVYNSLTKLPVDLAIVRLFDAQTGKLLQTKVTDGQGRYAFIMDKGSYRLEAQKINLVFPSELLKGFKNDEEKTDIYHGEIIEVNEKNSLITANIPLDPISETKTPKRIIKEKFLRRIQNGFSWLGFLVTAASLYISPIWYMWILLGVHLFILLVFRRISKPRRARGWGIVYDQDTNLPVGRVVARLFDSQFNKLVATEITDKNGRYHFLAGGNKYYVTYDHQDYEPTKLDVNPLTKKETSAITEDVKIKKKTNILNS